jgi:hypothetical protein
VLKLFLGIIAIVLPLLAVWYAWHWPHQATT